MKVVETALPGVLIIEPKIFGDDRGFFYESYNKQSWHQATGLNTTFVQDNHSRSVKGVLRGLHYQIKQPQGKLVRCIVGEVFDVAVDLQKKSETFGRWIGVHLSADNKRQFWVPEGFGHGFLVLSDVAEVFYKATDYYLPEYERTISWNDLTLAIDWPIKGLPILSGKDAAGNSFLEADFYDKELALESSGK